MQYECEPLLHQGGAKVEREDVAAEECGNLHRGVRRFRHRDLLFARQRCELLPDLTVNREACCYRAYRKYQVSQCLDFCTVDFCSSAYKSAQQKPKTLPNLRLPISSCCYRSDWLGFYTEFVTVRVTI